MSEWKFAELTGQDYINWSLRDTPNSTQNLEWENGLHNEIPKGVDVHDPNRCPTCGRTKNPGSDYCPNCFTPYDQAPNPMTQMEHGWHPSQYPDHIVQGWLQKAQPNWDKGMWARQTLASPQMIKWLRNQAAGRPTPQYHKPFDEAFHYHTHTYQQADGSTLTWGAPRQGGDHNLDMYSWRDLTNAYTPWSTYDYGGLGRKRQEDTRTPEVFSSWIRVADWSEIMDNAQELRQNNGVNIQNKMVDPDTGQLHVIGEVNSQEDPGKTYETELWQDDPDSEAITLWSCTCPWGEHSWGRTRQWKKYEGRPCKHVLALYWDSLGQPANQNENAGDEQLALPMPQQPAQPPMGQTPQDWVSAPSPGGPNVQLQMPLDAQNEQAITDSTGDQAAAQEPADVEDQPTPQEIVDSMPFSTLDFTNDKGNVIHFPGTLSGWKKSEYNWETKTVRDVILNEEGIYNYIMKLAKRFYETGRTANELAMELPSAYWETEPEWNKITWEPEIIEGYGADKNAINWLEIAQSLFSDIEGEESYSDRSQSDLTLPESWSKASAFSNGETVRCSEAVPGIDRDNVNYVIPRNSSGEVIWSDEEETVVIFPLKKNGPLESHLVRVTAPTSVFYLSPSMNPGPTRRR